MIESHTNSRFPEETKKEEEEAVDMCLALDMMMEEARTAGVSQGVSQGEGHLIWVMHQNGMTTTEISRVTEKDKEEVEKVLKRKKI